MLKKRLALIIAVVMMAVMALPMAAGFTPSATMKPAPVVVPNENGNAAEIVDGEGNTVGEVTGPELIVTPYIEKDKALYPEIKDRLEDAFNDIAAVDSLKELAPDLDAAVKEYAPELSADTVIVGDLFDVTIIGEKGEIIAQDGVYAKVRFKLTYDAADLVSVLQLVGDKWVVVPNSRITRNNDNTVDILLEDLGVLAFLVDSGELIVPDDGPDSPQTGAAEDNSTFAAVFACSMGAFVCVAAAIAAARKKNRQIK